MPTILRISYILSYCLINLEYDVSGIPGPTSSTPKPSESSADSTPINTGKQ